ncbi:hypothetical protein [Sphingomonas sp. 28-62-11]|uniref:hypothetical protein n=1 Tax=Sphingomonas sp. 28-62-11 TaxID=1970432 RepID=UPI000BCE15E5|nr:MAG: hypothetical protein B7Y49_04720 [Sphingomonas sp. 28-62-11]
MRLFEIKMASGAKSSVFVKGYDQAAGFFTTWFANHFDDDDDQAIIFAKDWERAELIWELIDERFYLMPKGWLGSEYDCCRLLRRMRHERESCARNIEGIGVYSPRTGWAILPIDYAATGIEPPGRRGVG